MTVITLNFPMPTYAFLGDGGAGWAQIPYLVKILAENVKRYQQLRMMIDQARNQEQYLRTIHAGLENSIGLLESLPIEDEKILAEIRNFKQSYETVMDVYGDIPQSKEAALHLLHDQTVAESIRMINSFKEYSRKQEENSIKISVQSREASPKGAARMQAQTSAQILRSLSQLIRVNTQMLKLQSESLAMNNKTGKESVSGHQRVTQDLGSGFKNFQAEMGLSRY